MAEKEGAIVKQGHEEGLALAVSVFEEFEIPTGLLPLEDVIEVGFVRSTGYLWVVQKKKVEHKFQLISRLVSYDTEITGYVEKKLVKQLKGVKAREFLIWATITQIQVEEPPTGKIHFKAFGGLTKTFPVEAFAPGQ
ncbi:hypothetical protein Tsubulata_021492 [Turnera subulata]|uniref:DUF538 family protein n=1 Tax=Turnera subulata TaxID=218843 RepID=A0A9Q0F098_9ROSI|nr:hypothetical protein Tsubulata_021492 [Turnera subulata]